MLRLPSAPVEQVGKLLKCKKADAKRQQDMPDRKVRRKRRVQILHEKIIILKITQYPQIAHTARDTHNTPVTRKYIRPLKQRAEQIIDRAAKQNDRQVTHIKISVEPERHSDQKHLCALIAFDPIKAVPAEQCKRQEQKNKYVRVKQHIRSCPSSFVSLKFHFYFIGTSPRLQAPVHVKKEFRYRETLYTVVH